MDLIDAKTNDEFHNQVRIPSSKTSVVNSELKEMLKYLKRELIDDPEEKVVLNTTFLLPQQDLARTLNKTPQALSKYAASKGISTQKINSKNRGYTPKDVRTLLTLMGYTYPQFVYAFQMLKGGSTKTASVTNLVRGLVAYGARGCLIDLDPQGNSTEAYAIDTKNLPTFLDIATKNMNPVNALVEVTDGLFVLPSDLGNSGLNHIMTSEQKNLTTFVRDVVEEIKKEKELDFVLIDCNPSLSHINTSIALASDRLIIPVNPNKFSYTGLIQIIEEIIRINTEFRAEIDVRILYTLYKDSDKLAKKYWVRYGNTCKGKLLGTIIKDNIDVKKSLEEKQFIFDRPKAPAKRDFDMFVLEVLGLDDFVNSNPQKN